MESTILKAGRGTPLTRNLAEARKLYIIPHESAAWEAITSVYLIIDDLIAPLNHLGIRSTEGYLVMIPPHNPYMVLNLSSAAFRLETDLPLKGQEILYDPYKYENSPQNTLDPDKVRQECSIPPGFTDILAKWYSVKFTYPDYNLICLRPGLGISLQSHQYREEHWVIQQGSPIVISGSKVTYDCTSGSEFHIPLGDKHTVINPSTDGWVILKETYAGTFDELDIVRLFNPNHYHH